MKKIIKKNVKTEKVDALMGAGEVINEPVVEETILNNGMKKPSEVTPDVYCDACGAALKQVGNNLYNINGDCNEFNKLK